MTVGQKIKDARKRAGLTQRELGQRLGITYQSVAQWENDLRKPKIETLRRIADALGVPAESLGAPLLLNDYPAPDWDEIMEIQDRIAAGTASPADLARFKAVAGNPYTVADLPDVQREMLRLMDQLNEAGQTVAVDRVEELTEIPKYRKEK